MTIYILYPNPNNNPISLGTPNETNWPGILNEQVHIFLNIFYYPLKLFKNNKKNNFKSPESKNFIEKSAKLKTYSGDSWATKAPRLDHNGRDLLSSLLKYSNCARVSARGAMRHPIFQVTFFL